MTADGAAGAWHAKVATVLGLVVHHCPMSFRDLCKFLRISHTVHQELLGVRGQVCVPLGDPKGKRSLLQLTEQGAGLAQWLPRHARLVKSLELCVGWNQADEMRATQTWCAHALQICRLTAAAAAAAPGTQGPAAAAAPMPSTLRLQRVVLQLPQPDYSDCCAVDPLLLQELAAAHLEELVLHDCLLAESHKDAVLLGRLTALQKLTCYGALVDAAVPHLPKSLRVLEATIVLPEEHRDWGNKGASRVDLTHLTQLQELRLQPDYSFPWPTLDVTLPQQLTRLVALTPLSAVSGAKALNLVHMTWGNVGVLSSLVGLVGPWSLIVGAVATDEGDASVKQQKQDAVAAAAHLSSCSSLTALSCIDRRGSRQLAVFCDVGWCAALSALPRLLELELWGLDLPSSDLLNLTALSALRSLHLLHVDGCDSAVATSLASSLMGLTDLYLHCHSINSCAAGLFSVVGSRLPGLRALVLAGGPEFVVCDEELLLLSGLTRLSMLALSPLSCSDASKQQLLAALPALAVVQDATTSGARPALLRKYKCMW